eukprot:TRINITY_DN10211_c0_g1_i1.p1 TRINITY_DN10211_c0_g1~~TRINITY_DN10211_c0_g1_i1.p1  ORF type:complete len:1017 (-),score=311.81 TRINITY_DN10211_c0_g1_i1:664-3714(-)
MSVVGESSPSPPQDEVKSSDSVPTSEEYEMLKDQSPSPENGGLLVPGEEDLVESLKECLEENPQPKNETIADLSTVLSNENLLEDPDHTIFHNVAYLGAVTVHNPKDEAAIQEHMSVMNQASAVPLAVTVSVPRCSTDSVVLREAATRTRVASFRIHKIIFFARGQVNTPENSCFAFTSAQGDTAQSTVVQCHVFRCEVPEAVNKIFISFAKAFKKPDGGAPVRSPQSMHEEEHIVFEVGLEIREDDGKGNFVYVPRDKDCFKLRSNVEKCVVVTLCQITDNLTTLKVERCFGMLVSPGRNVRHSDMQLLEGVRMSHTGSSGGWAIQGSWDPREAAFAVLNQETGPDIQSVYMTVAADLVINQIAEPVRFVVETKARIFPSTERFWYYTRRNAVRRYRMVVRRHDDGEGLQLVEVQAGEEVEQQGRMSALTLQLANLTASTLASSWRGPESIEPSSPLDEPDDDSGDEPLLSGSGGVSKECSETELLGWGEVLQNWTPGNPRPKQLTTLVRAGVPEALRGEVWQRLSGASEQMDRTVENYRILVTKETPDEKVIFRDIHRTFPAHEFFKEAGGVGQEALFRIGKAYSVYDSEIGYCQGQSFLIAALLLQMPEEQAFGVLVEVMHGYGLRDMFRENFEQLQLRFYQLDRLIEKRLPDLWQHFQNMGLETHMYASQWFLTLFSAKFPLFLVFRVLDVFMLQGVETIFQVSLALLMMVKKELLAQDFEGIMKYFRVNIPKRLRSEEHAKQLMKTVCSIKIKKLAKYEKDWRNIKEAERLAEDPLTRYERENKKLLADNMRLERENDILAQQLLTKQISMRTEIDRLEDLNANLEKEVNQNRREIDEGQSEKQLLAEEADQLKLVLKREVDRMETDIRTKDNIIMDYKGITKQLSSKLDKLQLRGEEVELNNKAQVNGCSALDTALERIRELELELAQTKLALVETECKNQDLTHQFNSAAPQVINTSGPQSNTWFTKTLSSIKEVAGAKGVKQSPESMKKSSSEQTLGSGTKPPLPKPS